MVCLALSLNFNLTPGILVGLATFVFAFQSTIGCNYWVHTAETCVASINGLSALNNFVHIILNSIIAPILLNNLGSIGTFTFYAATTFCGLIYMLFFLKESSYKEVNG